MTDLDDPLMSTTNTFTMWHTPRPGQTLAPAPGHRVLVCVDTFYNVYDDEQRATLRAWVAEQGVEFDDVASICTDEGGDHLIVFVEDDDGQRFFDMPTDAPMVRRVDARTPFPLPPSDLWKPPPGVSIPGRDENGAALP